MYSRSGGGGGAYERVSAFREDAMVEVDTPEPEKASLRTPASSRYSGSTTDFKDAARRAPRFDYKPPVLRTVPLLAVLVVTVALVGLLEFAAARLPGGEVQLKRRGVVEESRRSVVSAAANGTGLSTSSSSMYSATSSSSASSSVLTSLAYTTDRSAYLDDTKTYFSTDTSAFVDDESTSVVEPSTTRSAFVQPEQTITSTSTGETVADIQATSAYVPSDETVSMTLSMLESAAVSAYVPATFDATVTQHGLLRPTAGPTAQDSPTPAFMPTTAYVPTASTSHGAGDGGQGTDLPSQDNSNHGAKDDPDFEGQGASVDDDGGRVVAVVRHWSPEQIFLGNYLTVCVAVLYRLLWVVLYNAFNLIEPFRQLTSREGATAESAFFAFYQSQSNLFGPIPAMLKRRWALALVATAYLIVNFLPALASEGIFVETDWDCETRDPDNTNNPCPPKIMASVAILRTIQGLLGFCAVVLLSTTSLLLFNRTGLPTRPNSIATVASLMRLPKLLAELGEIPVNASAEHMRRDMAGKRYRLGPYTCANGLTGYGIQPWNGDDDDGYASTHGTQRHHYSHVHGSLQYVDHEDAKQSRFRALDFALACSLLGASGVVLAYFLDGNDDGFNHFFNSNTFGPRFLLTLAGTVIASLWKSVEQDAVVMAPYVRLHSRSSSARSTILLVPSSAPIVSTIRMLRHRYLLPGTITALTLAAEGLNVVISGIPYANGQIWRQFVVSTYISIAVLGIMILVTAGIILCRFREPRIPRQPTTLGAVMSYLCSSRMLDDFEGMDGLDERTRDQRVRSWGKKYEFTESVRRDGKLAWMVDEAFDRARC